MKQNITKEQWDELSDKEKAKINTTLDDSCDTYGVSEGHYVPTIGQMIEFLGDDFYSINVVHENNRLIEWIVAYRNQTIKEVVENHINKKELVDLLWEAVKYKLNDQN